MTQAIYVDIFADIICPWCYIGKKRLDQAFAERPKLKPVFRWRSFLLNPDMPAEGMNRQTYLKEKFGQTATAVYTRIGLAGLDSGIDFQFSKIQRTPDTRPIHKLLLAAGEQSEALADKFYQAYFLEGLDISESAVQDQLLATCGLNRKDLLLKLNEATAQMEVDRQDCQALGIEGVPLIVVNNHFSLAGAYPPEILLNLIDTAAQPA